jgi:replicative DNA helicase
MPPPETTPRTMPQSTEAEVAVLGAILLNPTETLDMAMELLTPDHFYQRSHQIIFSTVGEMREKGEPIDTVTLTTRLKDQNKLEEVGGAYYLSKLSVAFPTTAHARFYINILREKRHLRQLIETCTTAIESAYESQHEVDRLMDQVETNVLRICEDQASKETSTIKEITEQVVLKINQIHENRGKLPGLSWCYRDLDKQTLGLKKGEMVVIAARPGIGKTALALNIAEKLVLDKKIPVGVFSLEMTAESLALRMACSEAKVNPYDLYHGGLTEEDLQKFARAAHLIGNSPLHIIAPPQMNILQLRASARRLVKRAHVELLIVDYLQLMIGTQTRNDNREREVASISNGIKALAKELDLPIIALCQVNRQAEQRDDRRPKLSDLRESGAIEQDADVVCLLTRDDAYDKESGTQLDGVKADLIIAKNRNGPTGEVSLTFLPKYTRFEDYSSLEAP